MRFENEKRKLPKQKHLLNLSFKKQVEMDETINESKLNDASTENDTEQGEECQVNESIIEIY